MKEYGGDLDQFTCRQEVEGPRDGYRGGRLGECSGLGTRGLAREMDFPPWRTPLTYSSLWGLSVLATLSVGV